MEYEPTSDLNKLIINEICCRNQLGVRFEVHRRVRPFIIIISLDLKVQLSYFNLNCSAARWRSGSAPGS
jgi:hypothetical protein